jgi:TatD DNase family protein
MNLYLNIDAVLNEASQNRVKKIIAVAMSATSQKRILDLSKQYDSIFPALGIHPEEVRNNKNIEEELDVVIKQIISSEQYLCAIGEIGLDHYFIKNKDLYPLQTKVFKKMLSLAQKLHLPVNLHTKGAEEQIFETLPSYNIPNINLHWYSGPEKYLDIGIDRGYYFSINPAINYSPKVKKIVSLVEISHLLLESDGPVKFSGKVGTPAMIKDVLNEIALIKNLNNNDTEKIIFENTKKVFPRLFKN